MTNDPSETTRRTLLSSKAAQAYLQGALHDGTWNRANDRIRFSQKGTSWLKVLKTILHRLKYSSWIYREGKTRRVYVLETRARFLSPRFNPNRLTKRIEKIAYVRGFFDAEGGIPRKPRARFYIQLVQNDRTKLAIIKRFLTELGIAVGTVHQPSRRVAPEYWRMFVRAQSYQRFIRVIGSWHPRKVQLLKRKVKI